MIECIYTWWVLNKHSITLKIYFNLKISGRILYYIEIIDLFTFIIWCNFQNKYNVWMLILVWSFFADEWRWNIMMILSFVHATNKWLHFRQQTRQTDALCLLFIQINSWSSSGLPPLHVLYYDMYLNDFKDWKNSNTYFMTYLQGKEFLSADQMS